MDKHDGSPEGFSGGHYGGFANEGLPGHGDADDASEITIEVKNG
jgi:hypothetical protein